MSQKSDYPEDNKSLHLEPSHMVPHMSLHLAVLVWYPFAIINLDSVFLSSMSCPRIIKPKESGTPAFGSGSEVWVAWPVPAVSGVAVEDCALNL